MRSAEAGTVGLEKRIESADKVSGSINSLISLRKHIESSKGETRDETRAVALQCYGDALIEMGKSSERALPGVSPGMREQLIALSHSLCPDASPIVLAGTRDKVTLELQQWGENAAQYFKNKTNEVRDLLLVVARTAEAVGQRDARYASEFGSFSAQLQDIAHLEDLSVVRRSLVESAMALTSCVTKMTEEGRAAISVLESEVQTYRSRLEESERRASADSLTGLMNRGAVETGLQQRAARGRPFCVFLLDLNGFKTVNDTHGHAAGDDLLRQFSEELRAQFRPLDLVGRWGGDEFITVVDSPLDQALSALERLDRWVFGEYRVKTANGMQKIGMAAAVGVAEWNGSETPMELVARADAHMYREKAARGSQRNGTVRN